MRWMADEHSEESLRHFEIRGSTGALSHGRAMELLADNREFRTFFSGLLTDAPFTAFFWETPPLTRATLDQPFECVVVDAPTLATVTPQPGPFAEAFAAANGAVATFPNLGRDAMLVAPKPQETTNAAHLAAFLRSAPEDTIDELWRAVGEAVLGRVSDRPLWLNTSGLGVHWLHVRLDSRPKYYTHAPYRRAP